MLWKRWNLANGNGAASVSLGGGEVDVRNKGKALEKGGPAKKKSKKEKAAEKAAEAEAE